MQQTGSDWPIFATMGVLLITVPPLVYWYWGYRSKQLIAKKEKIMSEIREKYPMPTR